jgi:4-hydroxy-2-oxoheptanedioate aldolase
VTVRFVTRLVVVGAAVSVVAEVFVPSTVRAQTHLNPVVDLLAAKKPVFGLYPPANRRARPGGPPLPADSVKTAAQLAAEALAYTQLDYVFDGSMEGNFDAAFGPYNEFAQALAPGSRKGGSPPRLSHPLFVKTPEIAPDPKKAGERIAQQLNTGAMGIVTVSVESAAEAKAGIDAMRFASKGGTRPDDVGTAPAAWGVSEKEYREKADVWPLNPRGELVNFTIVESKEGLSKVREIAAVKGIGVLFPGAGTLRGVFTTTDASGQRVFDEKGWEGAIQQVLAACKEFHVACGYPANANDVELRMQQGFSVFVIGWGEPGFKTVEIGRRVGKR